MTMAVSKTDGVYYDPYDFEIDEDPYPVWKRMRDEAPLYYNEKYEFWALSRYEDVERGLKEWKKYSSAKGTLLEIIKSGSELPPGMFIFEDPPDHDLHRALLVNIFTPRRIAALEEKIRAFCVQTLEPKVGCEGFDFIEDLGAQMPMRTIGMLLGVPEQDQEAIRDRNNAGLRLAEGAPPDMQKRLSEGEGGVFAEYIEWRANNPSDDIMSDLLRAEFTDTDGTRRRLSREEVLGFVNLLSGAGNETTARLIGWAGKVLADFPDQRALLVKEPTLIPRAIEELLRFESPSPVQGRYVTEEVEHYGTKIPAGSTMLLLTASANRDERRFANPDAFDVRRTGSHVAFGHGIHFCLGAALARLEGRVALEEVLKRFPEWEVDKQKAVQARTSTVRGWETMPVKVK
ncbi:MAG: cytochrome P450 [Polyangiales bacterium]